MKHRTNSIIQAQSTNKTTLISFNLQDTKINSYIRTFSDSLSLSYLPPTTKGMTESAKFAVDYPII